ncbi:MFS transporter [uncultured Methylovirgula sp.]|uniref:MFS transporter n=1 Tax=uncultured Methylovirgula sp. TaxID=1285960 RepID=UPI00260C8637|nr:MFS transporter [uncultured Methylovirgula sp.]
MSAESAAPSAVLSSGAEASAQHSGVNPADLATGVIIGRTSEYFDFFVYAIASVLVFPKWVFPYASPLNGTLLSFVVFAVGFLARPVGDALFLTVERAFGRGVKLTIALFLMGACTVSLGFLPGYAQVGWVSALILTILRIGQCMAFGGVWDGLPSLLAIYAPEKQRGWYAMIPQLGAPLGLIVASGLFAYFISYLTPQDFYDWGWRYPFFVAFAINVVALFARLRIVVTPEYREQFEALELQAAPVLETIEAEGRNIIIGVFAPLASFAMFHMVTVFPLSWVLLFTNQTAEKFLIIELIAAIFGVIAMVASGLIANRIGRTRVLSITAAAIAAFSGFAPQLLNTGDAGETAYMVIGFILLGLSFGQASGTVASNFAQIYRYTASALTSDLAWLFGAGFAPYVALAVSSRFGVMSSGGYLLSGAIVTVLALAINRQLEVD